MRIKRLKIENVLSFRDRKTLDFSDRVNLLVGPNGAGKTNVLRALVLAKEVLLREVFAPGSPEVANQAARVEALCPPHFEGTSLSEISIGVELVDPNDALGTSDAGYLLKLFLRGVQASALATSPNGPVRGPGVTYNLDSLDEMYRALRKGTLFLRHLRTNDSTWMMFYQFERSGETYQWAISQVSSALYKGFLAVSESSAENGTEEYSERVVTEAESGGTVVTFGSMFPNAHKPLRLGISPQLRSSRLGSVWDELIRHSLVDSTPSPGQQNWSLERLLFRLFGENLEYDFDELISGTPFTTTPRILSTPPDPPRDLASPLVPNFLVRLFRSSVGNHTERAFYQRAQEHFQALYALDAKVVFSVRYGPPAQSTGFTQEGGSNDAASSVSHNAEPILEISPVIVSSTLPLKEAPLSSLGTGVTELLRLAVQFAAEGDTVLLLDEPVARLHPTKQAAASQLLDGPDNQIVATSHTASLLPMNADITKAITRVQLSNGESILNSLSSSSVPLARGVERLLRSDPTTRTMLFADEVLYVSGYGEAILFEHWLASLLNGKKSIQIINFSGDQQLRNYLAVPIGYGIPWKAIVDGKSFAPKSITSNGRQLPVPHVVKQLQEFQDEVNNAWIEEAVSGVPNSNSQPEDWLSAWKPKLEALGIFSLANCWQDQANCGLEHGNEPHMESLEEVLMREGVEIQAQKLRKEGAVALIKEHPDPTPSFKSLFQKMYGD